MGDDDGNEGLITRDDLGIEDDPAEYRVLGMALRAKTGVVVVSYSYKPVRPALQKVIGVFLDKKAKQNTLLGESDEETPNGYLPSEVDAMRDKQTEEEDRIAQLQSNSVSPRKSLAHLGVSTIYDQDYPGVGRMTKKLASVFNPFSNLDEERAVQLLSGIVSATSWGLQDAVPRTEEIAKSFAEASNEADPYERGIGYALEKITPDVDALFVGQDGQICSVVHNEPFYRHREPYVLMGRTFELKQIIPKLKAAYKADGLPDEKDAARMAVGVLKGAFEKEFAYANLGVVFVRSDTVERVTEPQRYGRGLPGAKADAEAPAVGETK